MDGISKTIKVGDYFVAFLDIVGQSNLLKKLVSLPRNEVERQEIARIIVETSEYVKNFRGQFDDLFKEAAKPAGLLDGLKPEQRAWLEQRKQTILWRRGFSDSYIMTVPCWYESSWGAYSLSIWGSLFSICGLFIWALAMEKPFRGAVEVGLGTEISKEEVYGPVNVRVSELEKDAGYPRVIVGDGLWNHLDDLERRCGDNLDGRHTKQCIRNCRKLITTDNDNKLILDPMGEGVKSIGRVVPPEMVRSAYKFVVSQERYFSKNDKHLHDYYTRLRKYCESRLALWEIPKVS